MKMHSGSMVIQEEHRGYVSTYLLYLSSMTIWKQRKEESRLQEVVKTSPIAVNELWSYSVKSTGGCWF